MQHITAPQLGEAAARVLDIQRSPLSPRSPWPEAAFMDITDRLYHLVTTLCPKATVRASVEHYGGGSVARTTRCEVQLTAPDIDGVVLLYGATPEETVVSLRKKWATARREFDAARVLGECMRLSGGNMTDTQRATLFEKLAVCPQIEFVGLAAKARKQAQGLAEAASGNQEHWAAQEAA